MKKTSSAPLHGRNGPAGLDRLGWVALAETHILAIIDEQLAAPHAELEARLWEAAGQTSTRRPIFFPHILQEALNNLVASAKINKVIHPSKAGRDAELYIPAETGRGRQTAITRAVGRKGMLYARYLSYSSRFGDAGETVVRESLTDAIRHGYKSMNTNVPFGEVKTIGTARLAGPLDSGAWLTTIDPNTQIPLFPNAVPIEVKNRRLTLYPRHAEVHQLLHKAAVAQNANPTLPIVPLLVCRRAHDRLFWMAKDLGFLVHQARRQFLTLPPKTDARLLDQIKDELALSDLTLIPAESRPRIENLFTDTLPKQAPAAAKRWAAVGSQFIEDYATLRKETLKPWTRNTALSELRTGAEVALNQAGVDEPILAWALEELEEPDDVRYGHTGD
jgi:hypothetical protein